MWLLLWSVSMYINRRHNSHENVQVALNVSWLYLGCQCKSIEKELAQCCRSRSLFVNNRLDISRHTVDHAKNLLNCALQSLDIGEDVGGPVLCVLGVGNGLQSTLLSFAIPDLIRDGNESGAVGGSLSSHTDGGGDVGTGLDVLPGFRRDS